jgi:transcription termination factor NusB
MPTCEEEEKYEKKVEEDDKDIHELNFGIDEEEEELDKEIAKARKKMNMNEVNEVDEELFEEDADDVDLDDLE